MLRVAGSNPAKRTRLAIRVKKAFRGLFAFARGSNVYVGLVIVKRSMDAVSLKVVLLR